MPLTHAPETVTMNSSPDSGDSFSCSCVTSNFIDCPRGQQAINDVRSRASARKTGAEYGVEFGPIVPISGVWFLQQVSPALHENDQAEIY